MYEPVPNLAELLDIEEIKIREASDLLLLANSGGNGEPAYETFWIPKANGGKRWIMNPVDFLKDLQRQIGCKFLDLFPPSRFAHGWIKGRSPLTEAMTHLRQHPSFGLSWDICCCFPSTKLPVVLATYNRLLANFYDCQPEEVSQLAELLSQLSTIRYGRLTVPVLPMGAPTSTRIVNAHLRSFDSQLVALVAEIHGGDDFTFTRYGDDLSLTSDRPLDQQKLTPTIAKTLRQFGYQINWQKVKKMETGKGWPPLEISGLVLDVKNQRLLISDRWLKKIEWRFLSYLELPDKDEERCHELRAELGLIAKVYGGQLAGRLKNCITKLIKDPSFHADTDATSRLNELISARRRSGEIAYQVDGVICYADWVPAEVFSY